MTVPSQTSRDSQAGNGVTLAFTVPFRILDQTHIRVLLTVAGTTTEQALTTNYTVSHVGEASTTVTFLVAPVNGSTITFLRNVPFTQETDYVPNDPFPAESHERALDKLTMEVQQLNEIGGENGRSIKIPAQTTGVSTTLPAPVALGLWGWDAAAAAPRYFTASDIATTVAYADWRVDTFTASAAQTDFTLTSDPGSVGNLDVSIDGVTQVNGVDFTYSGTTLTFAIAMAGGEKVLARYGQALPTGVTNASAVSFIQDGAGAVTRTAQEKMREVLSVLDFIPPTEHAAIRAGTSVYDCSAGIQAAVNEGIAILPPGVYPVASAIVIPDGGGLVGRSAFWKRRTGYVYSGSKHSVLKYIGASGANTCVVRASATAVGVEGTDFGGPDTDDLTNIILRGFHVDANGLADYGIYVYRAGNQATISHLTAEKAVKANHVHLGCFAAQFGVFGSYESQNEGVVCGWDIFAWGSAEATNFAYTAHFKTANNGTAGTYVAGTGTDLEGSGGRFSVGRGSRVTITSESNDGRACVLSQLNIASGTGGPTDYILEYLEGNADGPYVDYRDGMDAIRLCNGFLHPGNGSSLLPQNIKIEGKNNSGVVTANSGPARSEEWLTLYRLHGDLSGVGVAINSNTTKYKMIECGTFFTFSASRPGAYSFNLGLEGATTPGTQTYSARTGYAVRQENLVTVTGRLTLATLDGATAGQLRITGLPYRVANLSGMFGSVSMGAWNNLTTAVVAVHGTVTANTSYIALTKVTAAATNNLSALVPADISGTTLLQFTATYITDD